MVNLPVEVKITSNDQTDHEQYFAKNCMFCQVSLEDIDMMFQFADVDDLEERRVRLRSLPTKPRDRTD